MHLKKGVLFSIGIAVLANAMPAGPSSFTSTTAASSLEKALLTIAPSSSSCTTANSFKDECRTASQAAPAISSSFETYKIDSVGAQAALIAVMAFESAEFKYARNHFPGRPGQGARNMQMVNFNTLYSKQLGKTLDQVQLEDGPSFGAAAWFLTTQCKSNVLSLLGQGDGMAGWDAYMACVNVTDSMSQRLQYFTTGLKALGGNARVG